MVMSGFYAPGFFFAGEIDLFQEAGHILEWTRLEDSNLDQMTSFVPIRITAKVPILSVR